MRSQFSPWKFGASDPRRGEYDVFVFQDPVKVDVSPVIGSDGDARKSLRVWETSQSDVDGCLA